jgi:hypothetical protein
MREFISQQWTTAPVEYKDGKLFICDCKVMDIEEESLMQEMVSQLLRSQDTVQYLEIGYGLGISAKAAITDSRVVEYTVVELNHEVAEVAKQEWVDNSKVRVVEGDWQNMLNTLGKYDCVFFDTIDFNGSLSFRDFIVVSPVLVKSSGRMIYYRGSLGLPDADEFDILCKGYKRIIQQRLSDIQYKFTVPGGIPVITIAEEPLNQILSKKLV